MTPTEPPTSAAGDADLIGRLRQWLIERAGVAPDVWAPIEADLRREFGGRDHYVHRRPKAERLARLAALPADAPAKARAAAADLSPSRTRALWALLER